MIDFLKSVNLILSKYNIFYDCGTLLGIIRDNNLLKWEDDIDVGFLYISDDQISKLINDFKKNGFHIYYFNILASYIYVTDGKYKLDIKIYKKLNRYYYEEKYESKNLICRFVYILISLLNNNSNLNLNNNFKNFIINFLRVCIFFIPKFLRKFFLSFLIIFYKKYLSIRAYECVPIDLFNSLTYINFKNLQILVPTKNIDYLIHRYGVDWNIPKRKWITLTDDKSVNII